MTGKKGSIRIKRIYEAPADGDSFRVLTDRLWPRGISKERAALSLWARTIAPSTALRNFFRHRAENFPEFAERYRKELDGNPEAFVFLDSCRKQLSVSDVTFLYAARNTDCNHAMVLRDWLEAKLCACADPEMP